MSKGKTTATLLPDFSKVMTMSPKGASAIALQRQKTLHSGWLTKQGGWPRTLRRRWFEIKGDQLYYFRDKNDSRPLGAIPLAGNQVVRRPPLQDANCKYVFEIIPGAQRLGRPVTENHESYLFIASSPTEMTEWLKAIDRVIYTPFGGGMFGRNLADTLRVDLKRGGGFVPIILEKCVEFLRQTGLQEEGIFRLPGNMQHVEDLKEKFNQGEIPEMNPDDTSIHTVASLLKLFLRSLPEPVISYEFYDKFATATSLYKRDQQRGLDELNNLLMRIPRANFNVLKFLSRFLHELQEYSSVTKMTTENLALVFGPNILSPQSEDPQLLMESTTLIATLTECLIRNHSILFPYAEDEKYYSPPSPATASPLSLPLGAMSMETDLMDFGGSKSPGSPTSGPTSSTEFRKSATFPRLKRASSADMIGDSNGDTDKVDEGRDLESQVLELMSELNLQRTQFEEQIKDLQSRLDSEEKVREMLKVRLYEEHKARVAAEKRLDIYKAGIEEFCLKFGNVDISIPP